MSAGSPAVKPRLGRRPRLTRERVVKAALELIDTEGIEALTMRRLGRALGVEAMALYTYVAGKGELLDTIGALILGELSLPARTDDWQDRIRSTVNAWAALKHAHPRAFPLIYRPRLPTDAVSRTTEELLDALRAAGFDEAGTALAYQTLICFLDGALLGWPPESYGAGEAWRELGRRLDPTAFPRHLEVAPHAAEVRWQDVWDSGLELLLSGLRVRLGQSQR